LEIDNLIYFFFFNIYMEIKKKTKNRLSVSKALWGEYSGIKIKKKSITVNSTNFLFINKSQRHMSIGETLHLFWQHKKYILSSQLRVCEHVLKPKWAFENWQTPMYGQLLIPHTFRSTHTLLNCNRCRIINTNENWQQTFTTRTLLLDFKHES
jgi:hypothetical protein